MLVKYFEVHSSKSPDPPRDVPSSSPAHVTCIPHATLPHKTKDFELSAADYLHVLVFLHLLVAS
jgi:hypothetical protein